MALKAKHYQQARNLAMKWCTVDGAKVVYRDDVVPEIGDGMKNHLMQALSGPTFGFSFMIDRFNDKPLAGDQVCANFNGNDDPYGSGVAMSSHLSSLPLSSKLVPDSAPESGPSSGVDGSGIRSPEGILASIIIAVLGIVGLGVGAAWPAPSQMLKF